MRRPLAPLLVIALGGSLVAACGEAPQPVEPLLIRIPTQQPPPPGERGCMDALLIGTLVADARWGIAVRAPEGEVVKVMWPNGYVGRQLAPGIELLDGQGRVVARVGDHVEMGGGYGLADWWYPCG